MTININELRHIENMSIKVGENYKLSLSVSDDGQTLTISTAQTNTCSDEHCSYGNADKQYCDEVKPTLKTAFDETIEKVFKRNEFNELLKKSEEYSKKTQKELNEAQHPENLTKKARKNADDNCKKIINILSQNPYLIQNNMKNGK